MSERISKLGAPIQKTQNWANLELRFLNPFKYKIEPFHVMPGKLKS